MIESQTNEVVLKDLTSVGVGVVVDFAYSGSLNLTLDNVEEASAFSILFERVIMQSISNRCLQQRRTCRFMTPSLRVVVFSSWR